MTTPFELWLHVNHYRQTTLRATARTVESGRRAYLRDGELVVGARLDALRRYSTYLASPDGPAEQDEFDQAVRAEVPVNTRVKHAPKAPRKRPAVSFPDEDWAKLRTAISGDDKPEARVLVIMFLIGYRVGDVLGIRRDALKAALRTGLLPVEVKGGKTIEVPIEGAREVWEGLLVDWPKEHGTLANWVCPRSKGSNLGGYGAYMRVHRYFKAIGEELGVDSRIHSHRIRRTVGVQALKETRDIHLVQQLLGHTTIASTQHYLDEIRAGDIAELQKRLREKHG